MISRRTLIQAAVAAGAAPTLTSSWGQSTKWPESRITVVCPFTAGGASDVLTRILADKLSPLLGQSLTVENRLGAGGNIGMAYVKNQSPDGYTLCSATVGTLSINEFLFSKLGYDPVKDFDYVSKIWENCNVFVVAENHPAKTVQEFLAWAKTKPDGVTFGSAGIGTTPHLAGELFKIRTGVNARHIPFSGAAQSMPALLSGTTDFAIDNIGSYATLLRSGKIRALAVTAPERWPTLPDVPTMGESGIKDFLITSWGAFIVPKGTPPAIITKLAAAVKTVSDDPVVKQRFLDGNAKTVPTTPAETIAFAQRERVKWGEIVRLVPEAKLG